MGQLYNQSLLLYASFLKYLLMLFYVGLMVLHADMTPILYLFWISTTTSRLVWLFLGFEGQAETEERLNACLYI